MLQPGKYMAKALGGELREGKKAPYVAVQFKTTDGQSIWYNGSLSETQLPNGGTVADVTIRDLLACGWDGKNFITLDGLGSLEVELVVVHEPDDKGGTQARVRFINRPGERVGNAKPLDAGKGKVLNTSLRGRVVDMQKKMAVNDAKREAAGDDSFSYGANAPAEDL